MTGKKKRMRLAAAAILASLSIVGLAEASAIPGAADAGNRIWCC